MKVVIDVEANSLRKPTQIWLVVCKEVETGNTHIFRNLTTDEEQRKAFLIFAEGVTYWIGHNWLGYDYPVLNRLVGLRVDELCQHSCDTLVVSRTLNYSRVGGHSIEQYGEEFGYPKLKFSDWTKWSQEMEDYCVRDTEICLRIFNRFRRHVDDPDWYGPLHLEHQFQYTVINGLHDAGFAFDEARAKSLLRDVEGRLAILDKDILEAFPPKQKLVREFTPKLTKHGTISKTSIPRSLGADLSRFEAGKTYQQFKEEPFNPASHKQIIEVLNTAGWDPVDKTATHVENDREINRLKFQRDRSDELDLRLQELYAKRELHKRTGWKVNEVNLTTLPSTAPPPARYLAQRILLESRRRTLTEWIDLVDPDTKRIHGDFYGIGAWTHRMAHQRPNTANIPREYAEDGSVKLLGGEMRSLWRAPRNRLLVGVDAEGIQLRIFAHYINDGEFTDALVRGSKDDKTDPHSLNQRVLGRVCRTRQAAKRFIYALLLGAGLGKLAQILGCSEPEAKEALARLLDRYKGFALLKEEVIPKDAKRGYFLGLDGRRVLLPGEALGERKHLCMSGYLQNGEAIVVKRSVLKSLERLRLDALKAILVNVVHDEVVFEIANNMELGYKVRGIFCECIEQVGKDLGLRCPLAGSGDVGLNWKEIH